MTFREKEILQISGGRFASIIFPIHRFFGTLKNKYWLIQQIAAFLP